MASWRWLGVLWVGVLGVAGVCAGTPPDEVKKLEGTWVVTSATRDGKAWVDLKEMTFAGKELTLKSKDGKEQGFPFEQRLPFKVDPTRTPKAIDLRILSAGGWFTSNVDIKGIYELDRDTLKLCLGAQDKRPTEFSDKGSSLIVLKRQK